MNLSIHALDGMNSLLWSGGSQAVRGFTYDPYGGAPSRSEDNLLPGFNGERPDPISQTYHLGNGYRTYNPALMRFTAPDSWSPFGAGGLNAYAYCEGDPINRTDPSGHMSWQADVGIGLGVLSILGAIVTMGMSIAAEGGVMAAVMSADAVDLIAGGLGLAADVTGIASIATQDSDPEASRILGWISFGLGIAGVGVHAGNRVNSKLKKSRSFNLLDDTSGDTLGQGGSTQGEIAAEHRPSSDESVTRTVHAGRATFSITPADTDRAARKAVFISHGRFQLLQRYLTGTADVDIPEGVRVMHYVPHGQSMYQRDGRVIMSVLFRGEQPTSQKRYEARKFKNYTLRPINGMQTSTMLTGEFDVIRPLGYAHVADIFSGMRSGDLPYDEIHFIFCRAITLTAGRL